MALDPFQSIFQQYVQKTPDGRYFLPYSATTAGQLQPLTSPSDSPGAPYEGLYGFGGANAYYQDPSQFYGSSMDLYNNMDPSNVMFGPNTGGLNPAAGMQNALTTGAGTTRGTYNNNVGYYLDPNQVIGSNPATTGGSKPNDNGLDNFLALMAGAAAGGYFGGGDAGAAAGASDAAAGSGAFAENAPIAAGGAGSLSGSVGNTTLSGGAGADSTLAGGSTDNYFGDYITDPETGDVFSGSSEPPIDDFSTGGTNQGVFSSPSQSSPDFLNLAKQYGTSIAKFLTGGGTGGAGKTTGQSILGQIGSDPLGAAFSATPFLLALSEANKQGSDINDTIGRMQGLESSISGNSSPYMNAILNPYDQETGTGRSALVQDQGLRGIRGSSFGDQALNSYDYSRDLGRGDLASKALLGSAGLQGQLMNSELGAINARNTNRNLLLGAGLGASGKLFQPQQDPFNLKTLLGL